MELIQPLSFGPSILLVPFKKSLIDMTAPAQQHVTDLHIWPCFIMNKQNKKYINLLPVCSNKDAFIGRDENLKYRDSFGSII